MCVMVAVSGRATYHISLSTILDLSQFHLLRVDASGSTCTHPPIPSPSPSVDFATALVISSPLTNGKTAVVGGIRPSLQSISANLVPRNKQGECSGLIAPFPTNLHHLLWHYLPRIRCACWTIPAASKSCLASAGELLQVKINHPSMLILRLGCPIPICLKKDAAA